jgi:hypothetical protein
MGIWRCSLQNLGGQTVRLMTHQRLKSRVDLHARLKVADSMYHRDTCTGQTKARPNARNVPVKNANKAKRIEAFANS